MRLYDMESAVDWFYTGTQTYDEMKADPIHKALTEVPCVLYDNGLGEIYSFEPLESACARWAVPYTGNPEQDFSNLTSAMAGTYKAPGVAEAKATADEAKELAEAGSNPQLTTFARMQVATMDLTSDTDDAVASISTLLPDFVPDGHEYKVGDSFAYDGRTWRVAQAHTSQPQWVPGHGTDSLYYEIVIAPDGILVWRQPTGAHDAPGMGALRHYPDADGPVYESKRDGNISVPGQDEWWTLVD